MGEATGLFAGAVVLAAGAVVTWVVGRRAARGTLGPNHVAGLRTPATMSSPEAWRIGHAAAERWLMAVSAGALVLAVVGGAADVVGQRGWASGALLGGAGVLLVGVCAGGVVAHRAARPVPASR